MADSRGTPTDRTIIEVVRGDLTTQPVDAVVNAANPSLLGGGGVDGAIHTAAGPGLRAECRAIRELAPGVRCPTGHARLTAGHALPAPHVIHTVGPVWGERPESESDGLLASCHQRALTIADERRFLTIAFPCISTGAYGYPVARAARVALRAVRVWAPLARHVRLIRFVCVSEPHHAAYESARAGRPDAPDPGCPPRVPAPCRV
ncbi:MAG: O-acetyl-ADP-ribose deacetylase [Phycisphaerae bacterium]|nr:O-acetyl-ADP-ribose deacetylase [Phycisphaerae bacterium]